ncbi:sigma factor G inhibitor Gin [Paenibacillus sp. GCM10012307]|uniref:Sigma factor G inhibitor Gin n=1 Tax=Paenibacillus roseus TaxID=2798579 RepID=A0A934IXY2_9BACL|nr:sigma factor G inhibitor Gin [Paenibacillus roseus]MBJ6361306.1 sigma factor G inhibitor Gin [Paenibacillus roseus]
MNEENRQPCCIVCGHEKEEGIFVLSEFICDTCESEMVRTDVRDAKYPFFIHQLRQIWLKKDA